MFDFLLTMRARPCNEVGSIFGSVYIKAGINCSAELRLVAILMSVRKMNFGTYFRPLGFGHICNSG